LVDAAGMGAGFTASLIVLGAVREVLGSGTLVGLQFLGDWYTPALIMILPAGAFFTLGILMAIFNSTLNKGRLRV
jgi:electron transport complex protein RnfE